MSGFFPRLKPLISNVINKNRGIKINQERRYNLKKYRINHDFPTECKVHSSNSKDTRCQPKDKRADDGFWEETDNLPTNNQCHNRTVKYCTICMNKQ